jgi:hypothetical protein
MAVCAGIDWATEINKLDRLRISGFGTVQASVMRVPLICSNFRK